MKELANCKLQLEVKESSCSQAAIKLDVYQRTLTELATQLKLSEADRDKYMEECKKSQACISMLESEYNVVVDQLLGSTEHCDKLLQTVDEFKHMKEELLQLKTELIASQESNDAASGKADLEEKALRAEKEKNKELQVQISELNAAICSSHQEAIEAEKMRLTFFAGMEEELIAATEAVIQSHGRLEQMKAEPAMMKNLENDLMEKTILTDYYQFELLQAKELLVTKTYLMQAVISDERSYSMSLESEVKRLEEDLRNTREEVRDLTWQVDKLTCEIENRKNESDESNERELELQVEIATLKSEIHRNRSRIAAAEAAEARAMSCQSALHRAVQQLALEAAKAKKETQALKLELVSGITISVEEYDALIQKAKMADEQTADSPTRGECQIPEFEIKCETETLKEELDAANAQISDLKFTLEETLRRAEMAEKAKSAIEEQLRKWREQQKQRRAASESHQAQSGRNPGQEKSAAYKHRTASLQDGKMFNYVPLGKFLNMKL